MGRLMHLLLVIVFVLTAADPTPRFLGMNRLPTRPTPAQVPQPKIRTVLESYELPAALAARSSPGVEHASHELAPFVAPALLSVTLVEQVLRDEDATAPARLSGRNGAWPPLRC